MREQDTDARPAIVNPLPSIDAYDTILLASPIWNLRAPMIMTTFTERYDFAGKTIHPVTTYAMSGLGMTPEDYARECRTFRRPVVAADQAVRAGSARSSVRRQRAAGTAALVRASAGAPPA